MNYTEQLSTNTSCNTATPASTMFCYQCEQAFRSTGCTTQGVCGKTPSVAALQDLLTYALKAVALLTLEARTRNVLSPQKDDELLQKINHQIRDGLFTTVTNVNFDETAIAQRIKQAVALRDQLQAKFRQCRLDPNIDTDGNARTQAQQNALTFKLADNIAGMINQGHAYSTIDKWEGNADILSLKNILLFGIRGIAAYADHAALLGEIDLAIDAFMHKALAGLLRYDLALNDWLALLMECGTINLRAMEILDRAHTKHYGHPTPTAVSLGHNKGKAILISGHDLRDLELLLQQTTGTGISVYTHGEMLPAHGYPQLKKYPHLCGHYGTAWQNQQKEFAAFPGAILMTTNCIQKPSFSYQKQIFTTGLVEWPEVTHIGEDKNFAPVIAASLALPGFAEKLDQGTVLTGFAHNAVLGVADKVIELVKAKKIRHFFLVAGCDGAKPGRNYYTELVEQIPQDCIVLTLACGKFRFFDQQLGDIDGIPRLLDIGQCNDAYSAIKIAQALAGAFSCGVNELPLSLILSWYEQKAVAILLTLLSLGIKNIRLGPSLPAFITPNVLNILVEKFNIQPITTPVNDLTAILG
jgi:hydroxylamine reductase